MPNKIIIDYEAIQKLGAQCESLAEQVKTTTQTLGTHKEELQNGQWIGMGANAFYAEMDDAVLPTLIALEQALRFTQEAFHDIAQTFETSDEEVAHTVDSGSSAPPAVNTGATHTVQRGDTLWDIGQRYGVSVDELMAANPQITNRDLIYPGQELVIPGQGGAPAPTPPSPQPPPIVGTSGRSPQELSSKIDSFNVEHNGKYLPQNGITQCNLYAADVVKSLGAPLPLYVPDSAGKAQTWLGATYMKDWLDGRLNVAGQYTQGTEQGWSKVDHSTAAQAANKGYVVVAAGHGHIAVVRPGTPEGAGKGDVLISQAGARNFNSGPIKNGWGQYLAEAEFYVYKL